MAEGGGTENGKSTLPVRGKVKKGELRVKCKQTLGVYTMMYRS